MSQIIRFLVSICVFSLISIVFAATQSDPGPSAGGSGADISEDGGLARSGEDYYVNPFTGLPFYHMKLISMQGKNGFDVATDFYYLGNMKSKIDKPSWIVPSGWCGIGWYMGFSSIYVAHNNSTDMTDDRWFYQDAEGSVSKISRNGDTYIIENSPFWTLQPHYIQPTTSDFKIIDGWTLIKTNGYIYRYGDFGSTTRNASRVIKCSGNLIFSKASGTVRDFVYQWDLAEAEDLDGAKMALTYQQINRTTSTGLVYTGESYIQKIEDDLGDKFVFDVATKNETETAYMIPANGFDLRETKYLADIKYLNKGNDEIERYNFSYRLMVGHATTKVGFGYEKRYLTGIASAHFSGIKNRNFEYDFFANNGYLVGITFPIGWKTVKFDLKKQQCTYVKSDNTEKLYDVTIVDKVTQSGGVGGTPDIVTTYTYTTDKTKQKYYPADSLAYWGEVTQTTTAGSNIITYEMDEATHLFGTIKQIETYSNGPNSKLVSSIKKSYTLKTIKNGSNEWYYKELIRTENMRNGITTISGMPDCSFNSTNGLNSLSYQINSDGTVLVTQKTFAYILNLNMGIGDGKANMLSQVGQSKIYSMTSYTGASCDLSTGTLQTAEYTVWSNEFGKWRPKASYVWNVPKDQSGNSSIGFVEFNPANPIANHWQSVGGITRYNSYGKSVDVLNIAGIPSSVIYRNDLGLPIAIVANATSHEAGVFTCDYSYTDILDQYQYYWDMQNGWGRGRRDGSGNNEIINSHKHFGDAVLHVTDDTAVVRNNLIQPGRAYILSAWVKVVRGKIFLAADYRYGISGHTNDWPQKLARYDTRYGSDKVEITSTQCNGEWKLIKLLIPASKTAQLASTSTWFAHAWIGNNFNFGSTEGVEAYIDDVRFYPTDAGLSTTYYHDKWRKPIFSVDINDLPGSRIEYDNVGQSVRFYKIDKTKDYGVTGSKKILQEKEYYYKPWQYTGLPLNLIFPPKIAAPFLQWGMTYMITWEEDVATVGPVNIYKKVNGGNWILLGTGTANSQGKGYFSWKVLHANADKCQIKIESVSNSSYSETSSEFTCSGAAQGPMTAVAMYPANGDVNVFEICGNALLVWSGVSTFGQTWNYDLYFGTSSNPPKIRTYAASDQERQANAYGNSLQRFGKQVPVSPNTKYYWKVGQSPIWNFTTGSESTPLAGCNSYSWLYLMYPLGGNIFQPNEKVYVKWLGGGTSRGASTPWFLDENRQWRMMYNVQTTLDTSMWQFGCFEWTVPPELAGKQTKIWIRPWNLLGANHTSGGDSSSWITITGPVAPAPQQLLINYTTPFYIDRTEVTQSSFLSLMGRNLSEYNGLEKPATNVSWYDAILYCNARSKAEGFDTVYTFTSNTVATNGQSTLLGSFAKDDSKTGYRLPTPEEWQYAYRAGQTTYDWFWGNSVSYIDPVDPAKDIVLNDVITQYAWYKGNSTYVLTVGSGTHPVSQKLPNAFGLYDMAGNAMEWTWSDDPINAKAYGGTWSSFYDQIAYFSYVRGPKESSNGNGGYGWSWVGFRTVRKP